MKEKGSRLYILEEEKSILRNNNKVYNFFISTKKLGVQELEI